MEKSRKKNVKSSFVNYLVKRVFLRLKAHYSIGVAFSLRILFFYISRIKLLDVSLSNFHSNLKVSEHTLAIYSGDSFIPFFIHVSDTSHKPAAIPLAIYS